MARPTPLLASSNPHSPHCRGRQWRTSTRQRLMHCDTRAGHGGQGFYRSVQAERHGRTNTAILDVPLTIKPMHWLSKQQQHANCSYSPVYCEDRESPWLPQGPAMFGQKGMQQEYQSNSQFRLHSSQRHCDDRESLWPPRNCAKSCQTEVQNGRQFNHQLRCPSTPSQCIDRLQSRKGHVKGR